MNRSKYQMALSLFQLLKEHRGHWLTIEAICHKLGRPMSDIHKKIEQLRQMGHQIESMPLYGFRLVEGGDILSAELIEYDLGTQRVGRKVVVYESTNSTNDVAWQYSQENGSDGLAVFAEYQNQGRGRFRRSWWSPPGSSVLCSVLLQDVSFIKSSEGGRQDRNEQVSLTLLAGLSVAEAIEKVCSVKPQIKWPNDVTARGRKLAGIMVESRKVGERVCYVIGMGINCLQAREEFEPQIREVAVSLGELTGRKVDRLSLSQELLRRLDYWLGCMEENDKQSQQRLHDEWLRRCGEIGQRLTLISDGHSYSGRVVDISVEQGLLLQLDNGSIRVFDTVTTSVERG
ncbi:MAG: biotin--[acetyl-CoA-carboxylase] ligase [Sedimentisphaerales bacterium]|nr:biotin--[acetyl-CoA-carboxylase] ligase [Sedimentisphaerales bacterium]